MKQVKPIKPSKIVKTVNDSTDPHTWSTVKVANHLVISIPTVHNWYETGIFAGLSVKVLPGNRLKFIPAEIVAFGESLIKKAGNQ